MFSFFLFFLISYYNQRPNLQSFEQAPNKIRSSPHRVSGSARNSFDSAWVAYPSCYSRPDGAHTNSGTDSNCSIAVSGRACLLGSLPGH